MLPLNNVRLILIGGEPVLVNYIAKAIGMRLKI